jgi:hypothetical protein
MGCLADGGQEQLPGETWGSNSLQRSFSEFSRCSTRPASIDPAFHALEFGCT